MNQLSDVPFEKTNLLPPIVRDYLLNPEKLKNYYEYFPLPESFGAVIENRKFDTNRRDVLANVLLKQYAEAGIEIEDGVRGRIDQLRETSTFTITTGHQLCIFGGPLYIVYKILTAIKLARELTERYSTYNFVPVFWLASEDHDFEEISRFLLFGKEIKWHKDTQEQPVGRLNLDGLKEDIDYTCQLLGDREGTGFWKQIIRESYQPGFNLSQATRRFFHAIFKKYGLLILDPDSPELKRFLIPVMKQDIFENTSFAELQKTNDLLKGKYKLQVNGREVNFFMMHKELGRKLIKRNNGKFELSDAQLNWSADEIMNIIENTPEVFSPNVIMRPIYQEIILPNLAYIGGPAEISYWLQLKGIFDSFRLRMPVVMLRNSFLLYGESLKNKIVKSGIELTDLFLSDEALKAKIINLKLQSGFSDTSIKIQEMFQQLVDETQQSAGHISKELLRFKLETRNFLNQQQKEYKKAREERMEAEIERIMKIKRTLFPTGIFQERIESLLQFDLNEGNTLIEMLFVKTNPFNSYLKLLQV